VYKTETSVKFNRRSDQLIAQAEAGAAVFNLRVAQAAERWAHVFVPKKTGALDATIKVLQDLSTGEAVLVAGGDGAPYAPFVELGSVHHAPHPFMLPAVMQAKPEAEQIARVIQFYK
jgi:HK97 gp10 family phage protein